MPRLADVYLISKPPGPWKLGWPRGTCGLSFPEEPNYPQTLLDSLILVSGLLRKRMLDHSYEAFPQSYHRAINNIPSFREGKKFVHSRNA